MDINFKAFIENKMYSWEELLSNPVLLKNVLANEKIRKLGFTRRHDLETVPIYEGDILQYITDGPKSGEKICEYYYIEWDKTYGDGSGFILKSYNNENVEDPIENALDFPMSHGIRVVGNVYENSEMAKKLKKTKGVL